MSRSPASLRKTVLGETLEPRIAPADIGIIALTANRNEGDGGQTPLTFTLIRGGDLSVASSVNYVVAGSGSSSANAADFGGSFPSGTVNFDIGQGRATLTILASGDEDDEVNEQFSVTLTPGNNATLTTASAIGTIIDDDGPVLVVTSTSDSGAGSLRAAVSAATAGSTVTFNLPANSVITLTSGQIDIPAGRHLIVDGSGAANLTISGNNASRIFRLNSTSVQPTTFTVRGLTLANGDAGTGTGGAITTAGELHTLTVDNVTFRDNKSAGGGAIHSVFRGTLNVADSVFLRNEGIRTNSELGAGAIYFLGPNSLSVSGSTFDGNRGINGGAIKTIAGRVGIDNSIFRNNDVLAARFDTGQPNDFLRGYGGALSFDRVSPADDPTGGTLLIRNSIFENNQGRAAGGAIYLYTGARDALEIDSSSFANNKTVGLINAAGAPQGEQGNSGAIELQSDTVNRGLIVANSSFVGNRAVDRGGAIRMRNFPGHIYNNTFHDNRTTLAPTVNFSGGLGGALELGGGAGVLMFVRNNTFAENYATWTGGAILAGVSLRADNNIFDRNTTNTFANGNPILSHVDGNNLSGVNNLQSTSNRGQSGNQAIPGGTATADPVLAALANNGGSTPTRALQSGSPAINAGNNSFLPSDLLDFDGDGNYGEPVPFDQRGSGFIRLREGTVDIGAFELGTAPPEPILSIAGISPIQNEGNGGTKAFTFSVTRTGSSGAESSVAFAVIASGNNPANAADFGGTFPGGTVTFAIGETSRTMTIAVTGDTLVEANEGFAVVLSNPVNGILNIASAGGTILNDDTDGGTSPPPFRLPVTFAVAAGGGTSGVVTTYNAAGTPIATATPLNPVPSGGIRVATADVNGDGTDDLFVGTGPGVPTQVRIFDGVSKAELFSVQPFEAAFTGGVYIAAGDLNGDGKADFVITPDQGGGPRTRVFDGASHKVIADFFGISDPNFRGGARSSIGDLNGDGIGDLIVVAGFGGGPRVAAYDGVGLKINGGPKLFGDFFAFEQALRNGIFIAAGDVNGDGFGDLVAGGGPGGGPRVFILDGKSLTQNGSGTLVPLGNFFAGDVTNRGGIRVSVKNLDGDLKADIVVGTGTGAGSRITSYLGSTIKANSTPPSSFDFEAFHEFTDGVFVG